MIWLRLNSTLNWLIQTAPTLSDPERRRSRLLTWLQLFILFITLCILIFLLIQTPLDNSRRFIYPGLISGLMLFIVCAYLLNRMGHYTLAAGMTIACAIFAPWGSLLFDPTIWQGDFMPLAYVVVSVMLSGILLPTWITFLLAVVQWGGLLIVFLLNPATDFNWASLLYFVLATSMLSILANDVSQRDLSQIDHQSHLLAVSEAQLREQSIRDYLTNLFNRRYLEETLEREIQRAARKGLPLGVIMLDIDHFKRYNDTLGHAMGDLLLQELGKLLSNQIRRSDIACRYGGDEMVLILPEASLKTTRQRAEQLRNEVQILHLEQIIHAPETITISQGVAVYPDHGASGEALLKSADSALYRAKNEGRDRVIVANPQAR